MCSQGGGEQWNTVLLACMKSVEYDKLMYIKFNVFTYSAPLYNFAQYYNTLPKQSITAEVECSSPSTEESRLWLYVGIGGGAGGATILILLIIVFTGIFFFVRKYKKRTRRYNENLQKNFTHNYCNTYTVIYTRVNLNVVSLPIASLNNANIQNFVYTFSYNIHGWVNLCYRPTMLEDRASRHSTSGHGNPSTDLDLENIYYRTHGGGAMAPLTTFMPPVPSMLDRDSVYVKMNPAMEDEDGQYEELAPDKAWHIQYEMERASDGTLVNEGEYASVS